MARVELRGVRKVFENGQEAVAGISCVVEDGEFAVLVGPSGCGKTTTLRMLSGLETVTEGEILIGDRVVNDVAPRDRDVAMVFQNYALYPHMTVFDNMAFGLKLRRYSKPEIRARVAQAAEVLGITEIMHRKPKQLSGGQRHRVAVGRAIVRKPHVFLFDEPLSNLDAKLRLQMRTEIKKLHRRLRTTMVYVTHDQVEAMTMGDRIVVMDKGTIQQDDAPLVLYRWPSTLFVAGFFGSPAMNLVPGTIRRGRGTTFVAATGEFSIPVNEELYGTLRDRVDQATTLGIRPEDLRIASGKESPRYVELPVSAIEPMGNEAFIYDRSLVARVAPQSIPKPGERVRLAFDGSKLHFFDTASGESVL